MLTNSPRSKKLALGTAQFGMPYGVANRLGQPTIAEISRILELARSASVDLLDTAIAYGDSETILGQIGISDWKVVSKIPAGFDGQADSLARLVESSLERLGIDSLYGLLLHDASMLLQPTGQAVADELVGLQEQGLVECVGVSIYEPSDLNAILEALPLQIVQAPLNLLDQRMLSSGWIDRLEALGIEFHARSIFLQGLLLTEPDQLPCRFSRFENRFARLREAMETSGLSPIGASLGFVLDQPGVTQGIVGVDNGAQLGEILDALNEAELPDASLMACSEPDLIDPRRWAVA